MMDVLWVKFLEASPTLALALVSWIAVQVQRVLGQLRTLNGRIARLEDLHVGHVELDDSRFEGMRRELELVAQRQWERKPFPGA